MSDHFMAQRAGYHAAAKTFHWLVAALAFFVLPLGFLTQLVKADVSADFYFWHESLGFAVLWLMLMRLCVRFLTDTPPKPAGIPRGQAALAHVWQWALYLALIAQPIVGFLMTNAQGYGLTWFGLLTIPSPVAKSPALAQLLMTWHGWLGWTLVGLIVGHILAALYHRVIRRDEALARMS